MPEKSSVVFLLILASTVILLFPWIAREYLCRYTEITEFTPWLKPQMEISDP